VCGINKRKLVLLIGFGFGFGFGTTDSPNDSDADSLVTRLYRNSLTGLSLLGYPGLEDLDPVYCMPTEVIERKGLRKGWLALPRRT
jgi:hypothetical protein